MLRVVRSALCLALALAAHWASAQQELQKIEPKPVPPLAPAPAQTPAASHETAAPVAPEEPILDRLKGLVFISRVEEIQNVRLTPKLDVSRVPVLQTVRFEKLMERYLGQPVTLSSINALTKDVAAYYAQIGRPFVSITTPEQDITSGVVTVLVVEARVGNIAVTGARWFSQGQSVSSVRLKPGDLINKPLLDSDIEWINRNPFRNVTVIAAPGDAPGTTDLTLQAAERFPLRVYTGYENSGTRLTSEDRLLAGFNWGNAIGLGHLLNYQFTASPDFSEVIGHSGSYVIPLPWRHLLSVLGSYASTHAAIPPDFDISGVSSQLSACYGIPLPKLGRYTHALTAGFDFKRSDNNFLFAQQPVVNNTTDIVQWLASYSASLPDRFGSTSLDSNLVFSPGEWSKYNTDTAFERSRAGAKAQYVYGNVELQRVLKLPWNLSWFASAKGQLVSGNLLGSEQLVFGGYGTVRGYNEGEVYSDEGCLLKQELRLPAVSLGKLLGLPKLSDQLQLLVFEDYGAAHNIDRLPDEQRFIDLHSIGAGLRWTISSYLSVRFDYGWQLLDSGFSQSANNSHGHVGIVVSY